MTTLQEAVKTFPQMEVWNDSCSCKELTYALEQCEASGATTNPAIVFNVLKKELPDWEDTIKKIIADNPTFTEDDVAWKTIEALGLKAAKLLEPMHEKAHGQRGKISFQANAKFYQNPEKLVEHACQLASLAPNIQIKAPASKAGIEAFEEMTYRGVSINATVSFTVPQALAVAEAVERGLKRREAEGKDISWMHPVCTIMGGRTDDYLKAYLKGKDYIVHPEALEWAGVAVFKNAYKIYKERGYRTKLLFAAYRNLHHFEQFIGGDVVLTITSDFQKKYNGTKVEIKNNMDTPVPQQWLDELMTIDEFRRAYEPDGMKPEEFQHYGAFLRTINQFLGSYAGLVELVRKYMIV